MCFGLNNIEMDNDTKFILISHIPLPYHSIGSWSTIYGKYISQPDNQCDAIICPPLKLKKYPGIDYEFYSKPWYFKYKQKLLSNRFYPIINALKKYLDKNKQHKIIIQIIDNLGLIKYIDEYLQKNKIRNNVYLQYSYHGFSILNVKTMQFLNRSVDEIIFLTKLSYKFNLAQHSVLPDYVSVLNNGIDTKIFNTKNKQTNESKTIFIWCSQDRPKKGLHIILQAWNILIENHDHIELWIVGTHEHYQGQGIRSFGRVPNHELPKIYKQAHVYVFPTLWHEGFGLTLAEALHCGCFCIASKIGGVPEVLNNGEYGWLIDEPHNPQHWFTAMDKYLKEKPIHPEIPSSLYSQEAWSQGMNKIITNAKKRV